MCGIVGQIKLNNKIDKALFIQMRDTLTHRGPNDAGVYYNEEKQIALGHRRLSFLDLSSKGKQPLGSKNKHVWITFNGEIYNYLELKEELATHYSFTTKTDTEVVLAAYEKWGIKCLEKLEGMFSIAILDNKKDKLFLVRDRFGIKPLYYYKGAKNFVFASELKAILRANYFEPELDFSSFCDYFVYRYIPSPKTIYKNIYKVEPAHYLSINVKNLSINKKEYWKLESKEKNINKQVLSNEINLILNDSIKKQNRADVPIGSFLSGGYDSSAIVTKLAKFNNNTQTFSIGFKGWDKSEDYYADIVAQHLEVDNTKIIAKEENLSLIDLMPIVYDEPIADISIIPTYMVCNLAQKTVKAVMSGEGADELFGGYTWQKDFFRLNYPTSLLKRVKHFFNPINPVLFYAEAMSMGKFDVAELKKMLHPRIHKFIPNDVNWFYKHHFKKNLSPLKSIQYLDMKCFMAELVLTKIDRASMANSLEVRVPFLNHHLFTKMFSVKENQYYQVNQTKSVLYDIIKKDLPAIILKRKKQGFVGPDKYYMNKKWYKKQLSHSFLVSDKIVNQSYIDSLLEESYDWRLWKILVMEKWYAKWIKKQN